MGETQTDIVKRLREESARWDDPLLTDAADEIERLRSKIATALAAERAAILAICEDFAKESGNATRGAYINIAAAIKARGSE